MVVDNFSSAIIKDLELTETELFVNRLFVKGDYKQYADKFQINRDDIKKTFLEASAFLCKNKIPCTIVLILKSVNETRDIYVARTGTGSSYIINSQSIHVINDSGDLGDSISQPGLLEKPQLFSGKINKEDTILICSENLSAVLDRNFIQRVVVSSKSPEEACKKLLHSASGTVRKDNISVAAFNGSFINRHPNKERVSTKTLLLTIIPLILILIGLVIYKVNYGSKNNPVEISSPVNTVDSLTSPPVNKKDKDIKAPIMITQKPVEKNIDKKPPDNPKKNTNINFIVNGSVVLISNWESVRSEISSIHWNDGITDKKRIHKYPDYKSIPSTVKVTFKDNTVKSYSIK